MRKKKQSKSNFKKIEIRTTCNNIVNETKSSKGLKPDHDFRIKNISKI